MSKPALRLLDASHARIVCGQPVSDWVAARAGGAFAPGASFALGLERRGELTAGVIYENWNGVSLVCHIRIDGILTPAYLRKIFEYPFITAGVRKIIGPLPESNLDCRQLVRNMGFVEEARIKDSHPDGDIILHTLTRENCRFLGRKDNG